MPIFVRPTSRALVGAFAQSRAYATVETPVIVAKPPLSPPPQLPTKESEPPSDIDRIVLDTLSRTPSGSRTSLPQLIDQYLQRSGRVLDQHLPYESRPSPSRRADFASVTHHAQDPGAAKVHLIAHAAQEGDRHKVTLASGFAIKATGEQEGESLFITCAHTLEEIRWSPLLVLPSTPGSTSPFSSPDLPGARSSGSFVLSSSPNSTGTTLTRPITSVLSSLHRSDLLLLSATSDITTSGSPLSKLTSFPVSPYPAHPGTPIRAHFHSATRPQLDGEDGEGWEPWVGGSWAKWVKGTVLGYRDFAGREAQPGTYDSLSHMLFKPPPTAGSSGGPIIDEETGAVVGVMLGTRMDNRVEGLRGWGVPSESIFEMFNLPGLTLKR